MSNLPPKESKISDSDDSQFRPAKNTPPPLKIKMASFYIPKFNPSKPLGEDAHFISNDNQTAGVADGVGGWAKKGIDGGNYARELMANCAAAVANPSIAAVSAASAASFLSMVLRTAFYHSSAVAGSSTVCMVQLDGGMLRSINVGDSGFMLFRNYKCVYKSPVQQHGFNCPYQLGMGSNNPDRAEWSAVEVKAGDIVVIGTHGLMDNMFVEEIEWVLETTAKTAAPEILACRVARVAMIHSYDAKFVSPFAVAAQAAGRKKIGGIIDDITVIVGRIVATD